MPENQPGRGGQNRRPSSGGGRPPGAGGGRSSGPRRDGGSTSRGDGPSRGGRGGSGGRPERGGAGRGDRRDGGAGGAGDARTTGPRLAPKKPKLPEPRIAEGVTGKELDRSVHQQLRTLSKENAEGVAQHLVMVAALLEVDDLESAEAHAETAVRRAGRVPAAREALGLVAYRKGEWARALSEFRTARRLSGSSHLLALMVDCERGLGRPERALELAMSPEAKTLAVEDRVELAIVISGIRRDLGQLEASQQALQIPQLKGSARKPWSARLSYAYAEAQLALGRDDDARDWFARAADADDELETDAAERLAELDGVILTDLLDGEEDDDEGDAAPAQSREPGGDAR
ncbi:tetratricopeptide repeat protein [Pedococcus sp. P5_B7]